MKRWFLLLLIGSSTAFAAGSGGINAPEQRDKPYLILVSIDGFRWDYRDMARTPALDQIAAEGVSAERMIPVFPTLTFPNHYSIATGLYPAHHHLIDNVFPDKTHKHWYDLADRAAVEDGSWYGGVPVWVAAEQAGMVTAAYFFVGTEADIEHTPMTYWNAFDASVPGSARVEQVLGWLSMPADKRPHLITLYFEDVDVTTHKFGPGSRQSIASIERVDGYLGELMAGIEQVSVADDVTVVIVSDHGQSAHKVDAKPFLLDSVVDLDGLTIVDHGSIALVYLNGRGHERAVAIRDAINQSWRHGHAMLREDAPANWHATKEAGFAELFAVADPEYLVFSTAAKARNPSVSAHGWAPEFEDMHAIFLATGPRLPKGKRIGAIHCVDVYPLMMEILGLPITSPIDGDREILVDLLN